MSFIMKKKLKQGEVPMAYHLSEKDQSYPSAMPHAHKKWVITLDFTYQAFKKIADEAPFSLKEWAGFLHLSERTMHRYAKDNSTFNGLQIERILLFKELIQQGNSLFGKENFGLWLDRPLFSLSFKTPKELLFTHDGVQEVIDILSRIEHGIVA